MQRLLRLLARYKAFIVFGIMEAFCFWLIVNFNAFQSSVYFTSANSVTGGIYSVTSNVQGYFSLKTVNEELSDENALLLRENDSLKKLFDEQAQLIKQNRLLQEEIFTLKSDSNKTIQPYVLRLKEAANYVSAKVVSNSEIMQNNYITLNRGSNDGIELDMGVVSDNGVVGRIVSVSKNYSLVKTVFSRNYNVSVQFKKQKTSGTMTWDNDNQSSVGRLQNIPRHVNAQVGDTIVTSGFNAVFPQGTMVGTIKNAEINDHQTWFDITIDLSADLKSLYYVYVVKDPNNPERKHLELNGK